MREVVDLIPACKAKEKHDGLVVMPLDGGMPQTTSDSGIYITGKVLVWDMASDSRSPPRAKSSVPAINPSPQSLREQPNTCFKD